MKKAELMNNITRTFHKVGFELKKHSPEILAVAGVVGTVASTVIACKATTKVSTILEKTKKDIDLVHRGMENGDIEGVTYTEEDGKKDLALIYVQTGLKFVKLYAPAVIIGATSLGCLLTSNNILRKRNVALAAAYATVDKSFKEYRNRVAERFGSEIEKELRYNIKAKEIEETIVTEDGSETTVKKTVHVIDGQELSPYARFFDDGNTGWEKNSEYSLMFLRAQQQYANDLLQSRKHLFLNEVYDMLGIPRTEAGNVVGWIYDEKHPNGDNYVDFGFYDGKRENVRNFVNGIDNVILLDFNVDGYILDKAFKNEVHGGCVSR